MNPTPTTLVMLLEKHGATAMILVVATPLFILYFYKQIQNKSIFERLFDAQNKVLEQMANRLEHIKDDLLVLKTQLNGGFRTKGRDDDGQKND